MRPRLQQLYTQLNLLNYFFYIFCQFFLFDELFIERGSTGNELLLKILVVAERVKSTVQLKIKYLFETKHDCLLAIYLLFCFNGNATVINRVSLIKRYKRVVVGSIDNCPDGDQTGRRIKSQL